MAEKRKEERLTTQRIYLRDVKRLLALRGKPVAAAIRWLLNEYERSVAPPPTPPQMAAQFGEGSIAEGR